MPLIVRFRKLPRPVLAALLIAVGVVGRLFLASAPNIEPVLILSMVAGAMLGGVYVILVPVAIMAASDALLYPLVQGTTYSPTSIVGLGLFTYSGYVFVAAVGGFVLRRRFLWRTKTIAIFTTISVPLTIAYDGWTAFGDWLFITSRVGWTLGQVYAAQVPFSVIHIFSSLLFAPILGTAFLAVHIHGVPVLAGGTPTADSE